MELIIKKKKKERGIVHDYVAGFSKCVYNEMQGISSLLHWNHMKPIAMIMVGVNIKKKI